MKVMRKPPLAALLKPPPPSQSNFGLQEAEVKAVVNILACKPWLPSASFLWVQACLILSLTCATGPDDTLYLHLLLLRFPLPAHHLSLQSAPLL